MYSHLRRITGTDRLPSHVQANMPSTCRILERLAPPISPNSHAVVTAVVTSAAALSN